MTGPNLSHNTKYTCKIFGETVQFTCIAEMCWISYIEINYSNYIFFYVSFITETHSLRMVLLIFMATEPLLSQFHQGLVQYLIICMWKLTVKHPGQIYKQSVHI